MYDRLNSFISRQLLAKKYFYSKSSEENKVCKGVDRECPKVCVNVVNSDTVVNVHAVMIHQVNTSTTFSAVMNVINLLNVACFAYLYVSVIIRQIFQSLKAIAWVFKTSFYKQSLCN